MSYLYIYISTAIHKTFGTNSSFYVKFLIFKGCVLVLTKFLFWQGDWALGYHSMGFRYFPDIS